MGPYEWYTNASTRCQSTYDRVGYGEPIQCTRDQHDDKTCESKYTNTAWRKRD